MYKNALITTFEGSLLIERPDNLPLLIIYPNLYYDIIFDYSLKSRQHLSQTIFYVLSIYMIYIATPSAACTLCLLVLQNWCHLCTKNVSNWLPVLLITLANNVHLNPGPTFQNNFFNFMSWNVNSLPKDNFQRVRLIEAHNSIFNYDLISIFNLA